MTSTDSPRRGLMLVLSSPSGAGKTTIARLLLENEAGLEMSVSVTTRSRRADEVPKRDYEFVDEIDFDLMVANDEFLEHATVFDHKYGTPAAPVYAALEAGRDMLFDVDWQGARQLKEHAERDIVSIFILPPSTLELERRLHTRAQDSDEVVAARMDKAASEMSHWQEFDYVVVNNDVTETLAKVRAILTVERLKRHRQLGLDAFVRQLGEER